MVYVVYSFFLMYILLGAYTFTLPGYGGRIIFWYIINPTDYVFFSADQGSR